MLPSTLRLPGSEVRSLLREIAPAGGRRPSRAWLTRVAAVAGAGLFALLIFTRGGQFLHAVTRGLHASWYLVAIAIALEAASVTGYVLLLHRVVAPANRRLSLKNSYDITLGGAAATRLVPTAGLGGVAVTVWALRARGVRPRELTERMLAFLILLYGVYLSALLAAGAAVALGLQPVPQGRVLAVLGAGIALGGVAAFLLAAKARSPLEAGLDRIRARRARPASPSGGLAARLPLLRASFTRARRELRRPGAPLLGAVAYWGFDVAVLVTMLHVFGARAPLAAVVLAYFLGTLFNMVPIPGSLSSGLAGCLIALGSPTGAAIAAVLAYRAVAVWLPAAPGTLSLLSLRASTASWRRDAPAPIALPTPSQAKPELLAA